MRFTKTENKKYSIISAACLSLTIHFIVGALLVFSLSNNLISPPKLNGINLVWISLNSGSKNNEVEIKNAHDEQLSPAVGKMAVKQADIEKTVGKPEAAQIYAAATKESINNITPAKYNTSGVGTKEQPGNITGYSANKTAGEESNLSIVIAYPLYRENTPPAYPALAKSYGYEGTVVIFAEILPSGRIGNAKIRKSSGYDILDRAALDGVKPWKFEPAKKAGKPFTLWVELPITFHISDT
jgi:protein TonB